MIGSQQGVQALALACGSATGFGVALVTARVGLRGIDARAGAAISIPTATVLLLLAAPFAFDARGFDARATLLFALVGVFFPAAVTILTFRSNELVGPSVTAAVSGTAPLFAILAAGLLLGEGVPGEAVLASLAVAIGLAVLTAKQGDTRAPLRGRVMLWPLLGAVLRGVAQAGAKAGLSIWPNPFAASLIGYSVSCATVVAAARRHGRQGSGWRRRGAAWFAATGVLNGTAVLLMYEALSRAPVSLVAPVVATYPLVTVLVSALALRDERVTLRMTAGAAILVAAIVFLVSSRPSG